MRFFVFLLSVALLATQVGASEKVCSKFKNTVWNGKKVGTGYQEEVFLAMNFILTTIGLEQVEG